MGVKDLVGIISTYVIIPVKEYIYSGVSLCFFVYIRG